MTKQCPQCKEVKPSTAFYFRNRVKQQLDWLCKSCKYIYVKKYNRNPYTVANKARQRRYQERKKAKNPTEYVDYHRKHFLKTKWKMTPEHYAAMAAAQGGRCAICKVHADALNFRLAIDHCHSTGKIRGLLCRMCNAGIALLKEDRKLFLAAIAYIEFHGELEPS